MNRFIPDRPIVRVYVEATTLQAFGTANNVCPDLQVQIVKVPGNQTIADVENLLQLNLPFEHNGITIYDSKEPRVYNRPLSET
jgi:hypothetical protein